MSDEQRQRIIEVLIGPCTREAADDAAMLVQETLDREHRELGAAVGLRYAVSMRRTDDHENTARREREAINHDCPYCRVKAGTPCENQRNTAEPMKRPHPERMRQVPCVRAEHGGDRPA